MICSSGHNKGEQAAIKFDRQQVLKTVSQIIRGCKEICFSDITVKIKKNVRSSIPIYYVGLQTDDNLAQV